MNETFIFALSLILQFDALNVYTVGGLGVGVGDTVGEWVAEDCTVVAVGVGTGVKAPATYKENVQVQRELLAFDIFLFVQYISILTAYQKCGTNY